MTCVLMVWQDSLAIATTLYLLLGGLGLCALCSGHLPTKKTATVTALVLLMLGALTVRTVWADDFYWVCGWWWC